MSKSSRVLLCEHALPSGSILKAFAIEVGTEKEPHSIFQLVRTHKCIDGIIDGIEELPISSFEPEELAFAIRAGKKFQDLKG